MASHEWIKMPGSPRCHEGSRWHKRRRLLDAVNAATAGRPVNLEQVYSDFAAVTQEPDWQAEARYCLNVIRSRGFGVSAAVPAAKTPAAPPPRKRQRRDVQTDTPAPAPSPVLVSRRLEEDVFEVEEILHCQWGDDVRAYRFRVRDAASLSLCRQFMIYGGGAYHTHQGTMKYFVRWKGYADDENSWIGAEAFVEPDALKVLLENMRKKRRERRAASHRRA